MPDQNPYPPSPNVTNHATNTSNTHTLDQLTTHLHQDPGLPVPNPTTSHWQQPPHPTISEIQSPQLPTTTDILIIGSGITGCSIAHQLLETNSNIKVVMLDARGICSGATGRNGGHVKAVPETSYSDLVPLIGEAHAGEVVRFTLANVEALFAMAGSLPVELRERSEIRRVNSLNVFTDARGFSHAVRMIEKFDGDFPELAGRLQVVGKEEMERNLGIGNSYGGTTTTAAGAGAGAAWPYRLITGILAHLLETHPARFQIEANTPVEGIEYDRNGTYRVQTPRGIITTGKVIHATNGHAAHLLPGLRGPLFPIRGQMTAQKPHPEFGIPKDSQSWSIHYGRGFDYITQSPLTGEIFVGGGLVRSADPFQELGNPRDDSNAVLSIAHLGGIMDATFGRAVRGEIIAAWTGTMGFTADGMPVVGRVSREVSGRDGDGEFVSAGYNGYGMANAWLCGRYVADVILGVGSSEGLGSSQGPMTIPSAYALTKERLAGMDVRSAAGYWLDAFGGA